MAKNTTSGAVTIYLDKRLLKLAKDFTAKHPQEKSASGLIERLLQKHLRPRVRKYGLRMPDDSVAQPLS